MDLLDRMRGLLSLVTASCARCRRRGSTFCGACDLCNAGELLHDIDAATARRRAQPQRRQEYITRRLAELGATPGGIFVPTRLIRDERGGFINPNTFDRMKKLGLIETRPASGRKRGIEARLTAM